MIQLLLDYKAEIDIPNKRNEIVYDLANAEIKKEFKFETIANRKLTSPLKG